MHDLNDVELKKYFTLVGARIEIVLLIMLDQYGPEGTDQNLKKKFILIKARDCKHVQARYGHVCARYGQVQAKYGHIQARYGHVQAKDGHVQAGDGHVQARYGLVQARDGNI